MKTLIISMLLKVVTEEVIPRIVAALCLRIAGGDKKQLSRIQESITAANRDSEKDRENLKAWAEGRVTPNKEMRDKDIK